MLLGEFNSDDEYTYYCGQGSLRRSRVALIINKWVQSSVLGAVSKAQEWSQFVFKTKYSTVIQTCAQPQMPNKLKSNSSMKAYKTF